jgi:hypothetical protein
MNILGKFWNGNNFLGFLVRNWDGSFSFGYDAECDQPSYMVHTFKKLSDFYDFMNDNHKGWR